MSNQKIKIKLNKYVSRDTLHKIPARYIILVGGRDNGKSFATKEDIIKNFLEKGEEFAYIRRYEDECKQYMVQEYFADIICDKQGHRHLEEWTHGKYNYIYTDHASIFFGNIADDGKVTRGEKFGRMFNVNKQSKVKSLAFPKISTCVYEEFITDEGFLQDEVKRFMSLISTILRDKKDCRVYLVGNTLSRINPYVKAWQLKGLKKQAPNTIDYYHYNYKGDDQQMHMASIAVYMTHSRDENSGMFFGKEAEIITGTVWESKEQPHLDFNKMACKTLYTMVFDYDDNMFLMEFLETPDGNVCWYVSPKTTEIKKDTRIVSNKFILNELATQSFTALTPTEQKLFSYLKDDRITFADNLTGTEFKQCYSMIKKILF